jgi:hypothetical protein
MYFKSIIGAIFTSLAVMSFSANSALVVGGVMELETELNSPLVLSATGSVLTGQTGQMTGSYLGLDWLLVYSSPLNYVLSNNLGFYSSGTYNDFIITGYTSSTSSTSGLFNDGASDIISVTSDGTYTGSFGSGLMWSGKGTFTFSKTAPQIDVPVPATMFLFAPALLGLFALRRKAKNAVA